MTPNTDPVRALIEKWRGTHGGGFTSQGEFQAHLSTLRTCADELEAALSQQPASDKFIATFRCEGNGIVGTTPAKIHAVTQHDDGCIEVVIDHWPQQPAAPNIRKDTAVRNRDNADPAKVDTGCRHNFVRDEDNGGECCQKCGKVRIRQPAAPSGEAVAYRWRDRGTMQMVYSSTNPGYCNVEHLYTAPQQQEPTT